MDQLNNKKSLKEIRKELRNNPTPAENYLWQYLKDKQLLGKKFRRQHSFGDFIMDFYCPNAKLAVELDGAPHFTEEGKKADQERDAVLESYGIRVLRFQNNLVLGDIDAVLKRIKVELTAEQSLSGTLSTTPQPPPVSGGGVRKGENFQEDRSDSGNEKDKSSSHGSTEQNNNASQRPPGSRSTTPQPPPVSGGGVGNGENFQVNRSDSEKEKIKASSHGNTELQANATQPPPVLGGGEGGGRKGYKLTKLGWIPDEWKLVNLGDEVVKVGSGKTPRGGQSVYKSKGRPLVRSQNVGWGHLLLQDIAYIDDEIHHSFKSTELKKDDVLLNITGASIGRSSLATEDVEGGNVNQHVCIIRPKTSIDPSYLVSYLLSSRGQNQIDSFQAGGNRQGLNFDQIRSFPILLPTLREQQKIAQILSTWDRAISKTEQLIAKKQERKNGLMQQLLTGKKRFGEFVKSYKMNETKLGWIPED